MKRPKKIAKIAIELDSKGEVTFELKGKQKELVRLMGLSIVESSDFREIISDATFVLAAAHMEAHGIDIRDVIKEAAKKAKEDDIFKKGKRVD